ncbi:MAG: methyl-accepting chemotaxis protein [Firmicutes bacterium]|nr:methyl-accepting chemotaxis protein [Bacillota bacterium]
MKSRGKFNLNLRAKLILAFVAIALIPLVALTVVVISQTQTTLTAIVDANLGDQAQRIAVSVSEAINQLSHDLRNLSVNPSIEQMAVLRPTNLVKELGLEGKTVEQMEAIMNETRNLESNSRTQAFMESTVAEGNGFSQLIVVNLDGMVLGATERPDRFVHLEEPWFQAALENGVYVSDLQKLPGKEDEYGLIIATVIYRSSTVNASGTGRPAGIIRGLVPLNYFTDNMISILDGVDHGELQFLSNGEVIFGIANNPNGTALTVYLDQVKPTSITLSDELSGDNGQDSTGAEAITGFAQVEFTLATIEHDWQVRIAQPTSYALALVRNLTSIATVGTAITVIAVAIVAFVLASSIAEPIRQLTQHARGVAQGHLRQYRTKRIRRDETGELTEAFNGMTTQLARLLHRIRTASNALANSSQEISAGMQEMAAGAQNQTEDILNGTEQIEEMNRIMTGIDQRANQALLLSKNATEAAIQGEEQAREAVDGMEGIKKSVDSLGEQIEEVAKILALIRDIAEQTNLLALNASIEAARAGEQGRSFAVVAQEVGDLAVRSQTATAEIDQVLRRIHDETSRSIASVETGQREVFEVRQALQEITKATKDTEVLVQEIAQESIAQTNRTKEAVALFESIGEITEQTAAGTEETAAAAQHLAELASELQSIIASFHREGSKE